MKALATIVAMTFMVLNVHSCTINNAFGNKRVKGSKNYVTKEVRVEDFNRLKVAGSMDVDYTQKAGKPGVEIYGPDNIVPLVEVIVDNGVLNIRFKKGYSVSYDKLTIQVSSEKINAITLAGSGDISLKSSLKTDCLKLTLAGSGDIETGRIDCSGDVEIDLAGSGNVDSRNIRCSGLKASVAGSGEVEMKQVDAEGVAISVAGSGEVSVSGRADKANYRVAGSGDLNADALEVKHVSASVAGSGDVRCHATETLNAAVSGSGDIGYKGNPQIENRPKKGLYRL
ncbi:MAG: DUF2807 domain-containing protein [Bacteroides sp.]|nr:DUF2807 domain-containing protein [Bacteroides sp.]